jgi:type II secretory pathway pseudopilin PulG
MRNFRITAWTNRGSSLIETVIAMGVLAVAIPLVFGALAESGKSTQSSEAETRSTWIIPACMEEIQASRSGRAQFLPATAVSETFPPQGDIWTLAFSGQGTPVGKISKSDYAKGTKEIDGKPIRYIAKLSAVNVPPSEAEARPGLTPTLRVQISLEFPATSPVGKRQKLEFYTRIP